MAKLETIRAFVAVNLSLETVRAIAEFQRELRTARELSGTKVTWVPPANMHQTIRFLGNIDKELVEVIAARLEAAAERVAPFAVTARALGCFPSPQAPRVLWVGLVDEESGLTKLYDEVNAELAELGFERERRPFHPHVTLGRVRKGRPDLAALVQENAERTFGTSRVMEVVLYESRLRKGGAEYVALARKRFGGPAANQQAGR